MVFGNRTKTPNEPNTIDLCPPHIRKTVQQINFRLRFLHPFSAFSKTCKNMDFIVNQLVLACFTLLNPLIFRSNVHGLFMFVQNRSQGLFLEGPGADLAFTGRSGCHFRFSVFPKRHPLKHLFLAKTFIIRVVPMPGDVLWRP